MFKQIVFLKRNRIRKKSKLVKQVLLLSFDFTSLFYTLLVIGYFVIAIVMEGNIRNNIQDKIISIEAYTVEQFWVILTAIPIIYIIRSFNQPGVIFSTAEYTLTFLPNTLQQVWRVVAIERWIKSGITYLIGGIIIYILSPTSASIVLLYIFILIGLNVLMTLPEWKLFQQHLWLKIVVLISLILINLVNLYLKSSFLSILFIAILFLINVLLLPRTFQQIDWKKVTAASDFKIWNMVMISYVTKIKYRKERQYSIWQRLSFWKKPFLYKKSVGYNRLWHLYFEKNIGVCLKLIGALFLLLFLILFIKEELFFLAIAFTIHSSSTVAASLFNDRLRTDLVQMLPWDLTLFKQTILKWIYSTSALLLLPIIMFIFRDLSVWTLIHVLAMIFSFLFLMPIKIEKVFKKFDNKASDFKWTEIFCYILILLIIISNIYLEFLIGVCLMMGIIPILKKAEK
ncbi:hypothetical protein SPD48_06485 [Pseudogracilibacillus sp. SE30717A]|uniref:hypothetical protein n=1 Tax=Pseudogracilibacillus sp. SE30717A TaxID=3098293 RepID=UPI00300E38B9